MGMDAQYNPSSLAPHPIRWRKCSSGSRTGTKKGYDASRGFRVEGLGFKGLRFRVEGLGLRN